jgi:hypothetical protein
VKSPSHNTESPPATEAKSSWLRNSTKIGLSLLAIVLLIPIVGIVWLHINNITLTGIKGLRYDKGIHAEYMSLNLFSYNVTFHQLSLHHYIDPKNALDSGSYRLFAKKYEIELPSTTTAMLEKQNIHLRYIHFFDATFRFVDFASPLAINAHARKVTASAAHSDGKETAATQIIEHVDVTITNSPHLKISGHAAKGKLTLFFPHYQPSPHYSLQFKESQFAIEMQDNHTPVSVTIASLHPQWATLNNSLSEQIISQLSLTFDLNRSLPTMMLVAHTIKLEQPKDLPAFINRTDIDSKGIHLGQTLANLSRLPINKLKISSFTYGDLLIDAKVILKTPTIATTQTATLPKKAVMITDDNQQQRQRRKQARQTIEQQAKELNIATENNTQARFIVRGKALAPNPYQIDVNIHHLSKTDARVHAIMTRSDGNNLNCDAKIIFNQPLPRYLNCNANFKNTNEFTDRLGLYDVPDAQINGPLRFYAKQIVADKSKTNQPMVINNKIVDAHYLIGIELPPSLTIELNKYAIEAPFFYAKDDMPLHNNPPKHVANIQMDSDGKINFNVSYQNKLFSIDLGDKSETIRFKNAKTKSELQFLIRDFNCLYPDLQCHLNTKINARIKTLHPTIDSKIDNILFSSQINATWANNYLLSQLQHTHFQAEKVSLNAIPPLTNNTIKNMNFSSNLLVGQLEKKAHRLALTLYQPQSTPTKNTQAQLDAQLYTRHQLEKESPSVDYNAHLKIDVDQFMLRHEILFNHRPQSDPVAPLALSSNIKITIDSTQRNQHPLLPPLYLHSQFHLANNKLQIASALTDSDDNTLANVDINANLITKKTHVKLHRNTLYFSKVNSLKNNYFPELSLPIDITEGNITLSAAFVIDRNNQITGSTKIVTDRLSGHYRGIDITQLDSNANIAFTPQGIQTLHPISLFAQQIKAGVTVTKPSMVIDVDTQTNQYTLHRISAYLLGGSLSAHSIHLTSLHNLTTIPITVFGLNINEITDLIDHEGIEFTGILDGTIPIAIINGQLEIHNAILHSRFPGGVLRYMTDSIIDQKIKAAGHQSPLMVSEILKNYHYRTLSIKINYAKDSVLKTRAQFKGYNPDFQYGRPIHINLAIEENMLELIKTINILNASNIEQKISEHFNRQ